MDLASPAVSQTSVYANGLRKVWKYDYNYTQTTITKQEKLCNFMNVRAKKYPVLNQAPCPAGIWESGGTEPSTLSHWTICRRMVKMLCTKEKRDREKTTPAENRIQTQFFQIVTTYFTLIFSRRISHVISYHFKDRNPHAFQACVLFVPTRSQLHTQSHCSH